jgi:hypothetical protein
VSNAWVFQIKPQQHPHSHKRPINLTLFNVHIEYGCVLLSWGRERCYWGGCGREGWRLGVCLMTVWRWDSGERVTTWKHNLKQKQNSVRQKDSVPSTVVSKQRTSKHNLKQKNKADYHLHMVTADTSKVILFLLWFSSMRPTTSPLH